MNQEGNFIGRIQFIANIEIIKKHLSEGKTLKSIYNELVQEKKITVSYKNFARYKTRFLGFSNNCKGKRKEQSLQTDNTSSEQLQNQSTSKDSTDKFETEKPKQPNNVTKKQRASYNISEILKKNEDITSLLGNLENNLKDKETN